MCSLHPFCSDGQCPANFSASDQGIGCPDSYERYFAPSGLGQSSHGQFLTDMTNKRFSQTDQSAAISKKSGRQLQ